MKQLASVVSYVLHPFLMPLYTLFFIFHVDSVFRLIPPSARLYSYVVTGAALLVMPMVSMPILKRFHLISDYGLESRQERVYPILVAVVFAFVAFWAIGLMPYTNIIRQLYLVLIILLSVFSIITLRWKMSMHMTAIGAVCGFLFILGIKYWGDARDAFVVMLLLAGLLGSCRLYLEKHTPAQVYAGFLFGLGFVIGILF